MSRLDPMTPDPREKTNLPRWAQDTINALRQQAAAATAAAVEVRTGSDPDTSRAVVEHDDRVRSLPDFGLGDVQVTFRLGDTVGATANVRRGQTARVRVDHEGRLIVRGDRIIDIYPLSGNTVSIGIRKD